MQVLQRIFTSCVILLTAVWSSQKSVQSDAEGQLSPSADDSAARGAAWILHQLALLQFCRFRLTAYSDLLSDVYTLVAHSAEVSGQCLCCLLWYSMLWMTNSSKHHSA